MGPRLTEAAVEKRLREAVRGGHVVIRQRPLRAAVAQVDVNNHPHLILLDPLRGALMDSLIHELVHVVYLREVEMWGQLEEAVVEAIEEGIVRYINRSRGRVEWWRKQIDAALEADA